MNTQYIAAFAVIIGAILAASSISNEMAYAEEYDVVLEKMKSVDKKLLEIKQYEKDINQFTLSKRSFNLEQISEELIEINGKNNNDFEQIDKIYEQLKSNYLESVKTIQQEIKEHEKEQGLSLEEKKIAYDLVSQKNNFELHESYQNKEKEQVNNVNKTIKTVNAEKEYQKLINKIAIENSHIPAGKEGNKFYKMAMKEIIETGKLELAVMGIDRTINQINDKETQDKLEQIKSKVSNLLEKKEKMQNQPPLKLKTAKEITPIEFSFSSASDNELFLETIVNDEIISTLVIPELVDKVFDEIISNEITIEKIIQDEISSSLKQVVSEIEEEEEEIEDTREKQRKESRDNNGNKGKSEGKANNGNGNNGNGKGLGNGGEGKGKGNGNK